MANPEHIEWLLEGVESWNRRYERLRDEGHSFTPDFGGASLYQMFQNAGKLDHDARMPLAGADLVRANLAYADLRLVDLSDADCRVADFTEADLTFADLNGASLWEAKFKGTYLHYANLTRTNLGGSKLWEANLYPSMKAPDQHKVRVSVIKTIESLLSNIQKIKSNYGPEVAFYFRGEFECGWELRPSVMRDKLVQFESEMLVDLMSRRPEEFSGHTSALGHWVLAQHHGLKTRFLDITRNPLVALFHACDKTDQEKSEETHTRKRDGRVHVFAVPPALIRPFNSDAISVIANFARLSRRQQDAAVGKQYGIFEDRFHYGIEYPESMRILYQLIRQEKPYFEERIDPRDFYRVFVVEPQQSSERIRAQSGAFLVSAFHKRFEREEILRINEGIPVYAHYRLTIPEDHKEDIIDGLRALNTTRETLFPGLDSSTQAVIDSYHALIAGYRPSRWVVPPT